MRGYIMLRTIKYRIVSVVEFNGKVDVPSSGGESDVEALRNYLPEDVLLPPSRSIVGDINEAYCDNYSHSYICEVL